MSKRKIFSRRGFLKSIAATVALLFSKKSFAKISDIAFWKSSKSGAGKLFLWNPNWDGLMGISVAGRSWTQIAPSVSSMAISTATDYAHTGHIKTDGTLWLCGNNYHGQLGDGTTTYRSSPIQVAGSWSQVAIGFNVTLGIRNNGTLWAWGLGSNGQVGQGNDTSQSSPVQIAGSWSQVVSKMSAAAIRNTGTLWTWGSNSYGQLGHGNTTYRNSPVQVPGSWLQVAQGWDHMAAVRSDNTLYTWGSNNSGQLGQGNTTHRSSPVQVAGTWTKVRCASNSTFGFKAGNTLFSWGYDGGGGLLAQGTNYIHLSSPVQVAGTWLDVNNCGRWGSGMAGLRPDGTVWMWGYSVNDFVRSGVNYPPASPHQIAGSGFTAIEGGSGHIKGLKADGSLWFAGFNDYGNLGLGYNFFSPVQLPGSWLMVGSDFGQTGWGHAVGIKAPDSLWSWGSDFHAEGVNGQSNTNTYYSPVQIAGQWREFAVAEDSTLAIRSNGTLWSWGYNYSGILGVGDNAPRSSPVQVAGSWITVSASGWGWNQAAAGIKSNFTLWTWGSNYQGHLGLGLAPGGSNNRSSPTQVPGSWTQVAAGYEFMCGIRTDGSLYCWGFNANGQLGTGDTTRQSSPVQVPGSWRYVTTGNSRAYGIKSDGTLWAWGRNYAGVLGLGDATDRSSPTQIPGTNWKAVSSANWRATTYFLRGDGSLWMTGENYGALGNGMWDSAHSSSPVQVPGVWKSLGKKAFGAIKDT